MVTRQPEEIERLRRAGKATARLLQELRAMAKPGVRTSELNAYAEEYIQRIGGEPVFRTQNKFPGAINTSINDEAVHGVPGNRALREGDLLNIDCGMQLGGYCGDSTIAFGIGRPEQLPVRSRRVMEVAREALRLGIGAARTGNHIGDIGHVMQSYVERQGFRLLREYTGHGLGRRLWEGPSVPSVGRTGQGERLVTGQIITIEPIVVGGSPATFVDSDGWTVRTKDGQPAAQFEHTIMILPDRAEIFSQN